MPGFADLFAGCRRTAVHLEMRDAYTPDDPVFLDWKAGKAVDPAETWQEWYEQVRETVTRGVQVRRARIVSEPITDFIRYEYDLTRGLNLAAGEDVRWLPRRRASDLALPGNDFWVFDDEVVLFNHFAGDGSVPPDGDEEVTSDASVVKLCVSAFEAVWARGIPHEDYHPA
ncbi:DUF6879 family protein [Actinomadura montaniterrae]|uniref:DUF6879 domain-containing protein n=1 Tax=Actinomadura montaniterrae TaxID=1803903 RepID=A0A6L3W2I8_9ACTN|nr:DUF6879 family protein [Actinomadura montaniterrae]KAB2384773.1 hypothetical protein F9B16_10015 [Actinomadura montaniterrae]